MRVASFFALLLFAPGCYASHTSTGPAGGRPDAEISGDASESDAGVPTDADIAEVDSGLPGVMPSCSMGAAGSCVFDVGSDIRDLAVLGGRLYWVEYGSFDELDNYQSDGAVRSRSLDGGDRLTHLEGLLRPTAFAVTATHIYITLDGEALVRFPRDGEPVEMLDERARLTGANHEVATWLSATNNVLWAAGAGSKFVIHRRMPADDVAIVGDFAYFVGDYRLRRVSVRDGHDPEVHVFETPLSEVRGLSTDGTALYAGRQSGSGLLVARAEPVSGTFENLARVSHTSMRAQGVAVVGERYAVLAGWRYLMSGILEGDEVARVVREQVGAWAAAEPGIYTTTNSELFDVDRIILIPW